MNGPKTVINKVVRLKDLDLKDVQELELIDRKKRTLAGSTKVAVTKFGTSVVADVKEKTNCLEVRLNGDFPDAWFEKGNYIRFSE